MGDVLLIRHGRTALNEGGGESAERIRGWLDIPLDSEGKAEASRLAREFRGKLVGGVYTSPLWRARETAEAIALACKSNETLHIAVPLLPWQLGKMQGQPVKQVIKEMNYYVENEDAPVPGGEPFSAYRTRFLPFVLRKVLEAEKLPKGEEIILVTHSRGLQITKAWVANGSPEDCTIATSRMLDYKDETGTGGQMRLRNEA